MADKTISKICVELGSTACQRGDYSLTYMLYNRAFTSATEEQNLMLAKTLKKIGTLYAIEEEFKEAQKFLKRALTICQAMSAVGLTELRDVLDELADLSHKQGNFSKAIHYYEYAMQVEESLDEKDVAKRHRRLNQIAWLQLRQGQMAESRTMRSQISKIQALQMRSH